MRRLVAILLVIYFIIFVASYGSSLADDRNPFPGLPAIALSLPWSWLALSLPAHVDRMRQNAKAPDVAAPDDSGLTQGQMVGLALAGLINPFLVILSYRLYARYHRRNYEEE